MLISLNASYSYITNLFLAIPLPPLILPLIAYIVGISNYYVYGMAPVLILPCIFFAIFCIASKRIQLLTYCLVPCLLGFYLFHRQQTAFIIFNDQWDRKIVSIRGSVADITRTHDKRNPYIVTIASNNIKDSSQESWHPMHYTISIYCHQKPTCDVDDQIEINNIPYKKPDGSYALYLLKEGSCASLFTRSFESTILAHGTSIRRCLHAYRNTMIHHFRQAMSRDTFAFFCALFLGNKVAVKPVLEEHKIQFQIWGISHYLARSGLHMVIITMLLLTLMSLLPIHVRYKRILVISMSLIYHMLSWPSISFLRSLYTVLLYFCCNLFSLPIYALHIFCLVCFFILLFNPAQLLFLDFQLSFGLTCALAWFNQIVAQRRLFAQNY